MASPTAVAYRNRDHRSIAGIFVLVVTALALTVAVTISAPASHAAGVQVTKAEFKKVKKGMTYQKVKKVVGANGKLLGDSASSCFVRTYRGWGGNTVTFMWDDFDGNGTSTLVSKGANPFGIIPICPGVS